MLLGIIGGLGVFLYGMRVMSEGLQRVAGDRLRSVVGKITNNRFTGVVTGFTVTSFIQSSSATTVMVVSFVTSGILTLHQSIGIIMGANIGTTVTGWIVSLLGFKVKISSFALPAVALGVFARFLKQERLRLWGEVLVGFGLLFLGLGFLKDALPDLKHSGELASWLHRYSAHGIASTLATVAVGTVATVVVQSSSAVMAMTLAAAAKGLVDFPTAAALVLGENIGTTATALLASIGTRREAVRAALVHTIFNLAGVTWVLILFVPFCRLVDLLVPGDSSMASGVPVHLAMFHTVFNVTNTLIFLPFTTVLAKLVEKLVPEPASPEAPRLEAVEPALMAIPDMDVVKARRETEQMLFTVVRMFDDAMALVSHPDSKLGDVVERVGRSELQVDEMEKAITRFLATVSRFELSESLSAEVSRLIQMVSDIERIGDHCERIVKLAKRRYDEGLRFDEGSQADLEELGTTVRSMLELLLSGLSFARGDLFQEARLHEDKINERRRAMRARRVERIKRGDCPVEEGLVYLDMLTSLEKIGDHGFNVAEALAGRR